MINDFYSQEENRKVSEEFDLGPHPNATRTFLRHMPSICATTFSTVSLDHASRHRSIVNQNIANPNSHSSSSQESVD